MVPFLGRFINHNNVIYSSQGQQVPGNALSRWLYFVMSSERINISHKQYVPRYAMMGGDGIEYLYFNLCK